EVCVYDWIEVIKQEITREFIIRTSFEEQQNDPRALNVYTIENAKKNFQYLIDYNQKRQEEVFRNRLESCSICTDIIPDVDCIRLHRCGHFYCRTCLNQYIRMTLENGKFGENLLFPQDHCKQALLSREIKQTIQNEKIYERYERLALQYGLESIKDIVWCPRCQPLVISSPEDGNLAICDQCRYTFYYSIEQMKLLKQKELELLKKEKKVALAQLNRTKEKKKTFNEQRINTQTYRHIFIKLSEQNTLLQEILAAERINTDDIQFCPECHIPIEKNGGCSHMHCTRCNFDFTWQTTQEPTQTVITPYLERNDSTEIESIKEELNKVAYLFDTPMEEKIKQHEEISSDEAHEQEQQKNDDDLSILIDNESTIGSFILNRVTTCPNEAYRKINVKVTQDNWMLCSACMKQFCFLCGSGVNGINHFEKKCLRSSPV
ncbi:unnamed protein product, partial [Rotaria sp. Silwood2]